MENKVQVQDHSQEILSVIRSNASPGILRNKLEDYHENDLADIFPELTLAERRKICRILDTDMLSDIFEHIDQKQAAEYLDEMDVKKAAAILSAMETDAVVDVLKMTSKEKRSLLTELLDDDAKKDIAVIAAFDEDEIGSWMTTNCIVIRENLTVKQAMSSLVEQAAKNDNISTIFMVTEDQTFYGAMDLKDLIIARQDSALEDLIVTSYPYVYGHELIDDCIEKLKDYSEDSIPVLNNNNKLLGVITSQSIVDLVDDEMGEDYAKFAGLTAEEDLKEPLKESLKKRLPWLLVLLALGMVVSSVVGLFEQVVSQLPVPDSGHGRKRWYPVSGCYHPCAYGRVPYRKAEAGTGMEGNAHCLLKWSDPWRTFFHSHWLIHCGRKRKAFCIRLCCIRLYRSCVTFSNGDLRCRRYLYPTVL